MAITVVRPGDTSKPDPFTIGIIANPVIERARNGTFARDPVVTNQPVFDMAVRHTVNALLGQLPGQRENLFADPAMAARVRIVSSFDPTLPVSSANSLVTESKYITQQLEPRALPIRLFLQRLGFGADVVYAVSASPTHNRASATFTKDDDASPGVPFTLNGLTRYHRTRSLLPGTIAIHALTTSVTPLHEFQHAISSYTNCAVVDLDLDNFEVNADGVIALNNRRGRPIPSEFGTYNNIALASDPVRDSLGYEDEWQSYHCEPISSTEPVLMDAYSRAPRPEQCQNDTITRRFLIDRIRARMSR